MILALLDHPLAGYDETVHNAEISSPKIIIPLDVEVNISDFGLVPAEYGDGVTVTWSLDD